MSRRVILDLAAGEFDPRSPACAGFLLELCKLVSAYREEWGEILGQADQWKVRAALHVLGVMASGGPKGGKPPVQAICGQMEKFEREDGAERTDEDWRCYFFRTFINEQKRHIARELGSGANGELRRRLRSAFVEAGVVSSDEEHYGPESATIHDLDAKEAIECLGERAPTGSSAAYSVVLPTVGDLKELISDLIAEFPNCAPRFGIWMLIAQTVFQIKSEGNTIPWDGPNGDQGADGGADAFNDPGTAFDGREWVTSHADMGNARSLIEEILTGLDHEISFPEGKHAKTFVEFLLWSENKGPLELRCTQQEYASKVGVSDSTITNYGKAIFKALKEGGLFEYDDDAIVDAFRQLQEQFLPQHLEVFNRASLDEGNETDDPVKPS